MKKILLFALCICFSSCLFSQDILITNDDKVLEVKVIQVYDAVIKYALFSEPDGQTYLILKSKIKSLTYESGVVEYFQSANNNSAAPNVNNDNKPSVPAQTEQIRKNVIKANLFPTLYALYYGAFELDLQYSRYLTPKFAIPVQLEICGMRNLGIWFTLQTGFEVVPFTHRQKSGLLINALGGIIAVQGNVGFIGHADIGYQLVSKGGFVFNMALGPGYDSFTNKVGFHFMLCFGGAF